MKKIIVTGLFIATTFFVSAQKAEDLINAKEAERIERVLASDEMKGRRTFSPEIDKAADFIAAEFKAAGLQTWNNSNSYLQPFSIVSPKQTSLTGKIDGKDVDPKNIVLITTQPDVKISSSSGYETAAIKAGASFFQEAIALAQSAKNTVVLVDTSFSRDFPRLSRLKRGGFKKENNV